jgi:hypothetical protein
MKEMGIIFSLFHLSTFVDPFADKKNIYHYIASRDFIGGV